MIQKPTDKEHSHAVDWIIKNKQFYQYPNEIAMAYSEKFGIWETDIGFDGNEREFPPIWVMDICRNMLYFGYPY